MDLRVNLAERLRDVREQNNLSQADLATRLGVARRTVQNWEAGMEPQMRHRRLLADFLSQAPEAVA
jgi:transcriptional regulator with XRE-family HTH domain